MLNLSELFPQGLKGIIFDVDGVLIDSLEANRFYYDRLLAGLNLPPLTKEQMAFAFSATVKEAMLKMTPPELHAGLDDYIPHAVNYVQEVLPKIKMMPGAREFIEKAHGFGLHLAIDTNRTDFGIERVLDFFSLPPYFRPVMSSSVAEAKPSPEGAQLICEAWDVDPAQTLFIGDSEDDHLAARGAGCRFAAFGDKGLACDIKATSFHELGRTIWPFMEESQPGA